MLMGCGRASTYKRMATSARKIESKDCADLGIVKHPFPHGLPSRREISDIALALQSADGLMQDVFRAIDIDQDGRISKERE